MGVPLLSRLAFIPWSFCLSLLNSWDEQHLLAHPVCTYKLANPSLKQQAVSFQPSSMLTKNQWESVPNPWL